MQIESYIQLIKKDAQEKKTIFEFAGQNYKLISICADGDCLFHAVTYLLFLKEIYNDTIINDWLPNTESVKNPAGNLRKVVLAYINKNKKELSDIYSDNIISEVIQTLNKKATASDESSYPDSTTVSLLAKLFGVCICVITKQSNNIFVRQCYNSSGNFMENVNTNICNSRLIYLKHQGNHFSALITISKKKKMHSHLNSLINIVTKSGLLLSMNKIRGVVTALEMVDDRYYYDEHLWVYLTAAIEFILAEVLELSGNNAQYNKKHHITMRDIRIAIQGDDQLSDLFEKLEVFIFERRNMNRDMDTNYMADILDILRVSHSDMKLSSTANKYIHSIIHYLLTILTTEFKKTKDMKTAIKHVFPNELTKHAISEGERALNKIHN